MIATELGGIALIAVEEDTRTQIDRILSSRVLHSSDGLRRLLRFLADKSLAGEADQLKEYSIGLDAFGKPDSYDPRQDSTVRIQVSRLRQKLAEYYQEEGKNDPIVIELPKGRFKITWCHRPSLDSGFQATPVVIHARPVIERWAIGLLVLVVAGCFAWMGHLNLQFRQIQLERSAQRAFWTEDLVALWAPFLETDRPLLISVGAPLFMAVPGFGFFRDTHINQVEDLQKSSSISAIQKTLKATEVKPIHYYAPFGDVTVTFLLGKVLTPRKAQISIVKSNELSWSQLSENNVLFIGSPRFFGQQNDLPIEQPLVLEPDRGVYNLSPQPGEPGIFVDKFNVDMNDGVTYALVTHSPGPQRTGDVLSFASINSAGIMGAVQWFLDPAAARTLVSKLRRPDGHMPRYYQVLLKVTFGGGVPLKTSFVLDRELQIPTML